MSRDSQRYRKTYSYYRVQPKVTTLEIIVDETSDWKHSVRVASPGSSVNLSGATPLSIDGIALVDEDRVLLKDQTTENGIYYYEVSENGLTYSLVRSSDARQGTLSSGASVYVEEGTLNEKTMWRLTSKDPITVGTSNQAWESFSTVGQYPVNIFTTTANKAKTTYSASFDSTNRYPDAIGSDVFFFVSGSRTNRAVFGGDVVGSGSLATSYSYGGSTHGINIGLRNIISGVATNTYTSLGHYFYGGDGTTQRLIIDSSGNALLGGTLGFVATPARLYVTGSSTSTHTTMIVKAGVAKPSGGAGILNVTDNEDNSLLFISGSGYVGIGTMTPSESLSVHNGAQDRIGLGVSSAVSTLYLGSKFTGEAYRTLEFDRSTGNLDLYYGTVGSTLTSSLTVDSSGNIGIGTSIYTARFHVSGSSAAGTPTMIVKEGVVSPTGGAGTFDVQDSTGTSLLFVSGSGGVGINTNNPGVANLYVSSSLTGNAASALMIGGQAFGVSINTYKGQTQLFQLANGTTEVMRLNTAANVGIGTNSFTARLFVSGSSTATTPTMIVREGVVSPTGGVGAFNVQNSEGTSLLFVSGSGNVGIGTITPNEALSVHNGGPDRVGFGVAGALSTLYLGSKNSGAAYRALEFDRSTGNLDLYYGTVGSTLTSSLTVDLNGNIGVGTDTFTGRLYVSGSSSSTTPTLVVREGQRTAFGTPIFEIQNSLGTSLLYVTGALGSVGGRVGIGTTQPNAKLHVSSSYGGSSHGISIGLPNILGLASNTYTSLQHNFYGGDGTTQRLLLDSSGNALLGGELPGLAANTARLFVTGSSTSSDDTLRIQEGVASPTDGAAVVRVQDNAGNPILFVTSSSAISTGRVGIGTDVPLGIFHVSGSSMGVNGAELIIGSWFFGSINRFSANSQFFMAADKVTERFRIDTSGHVVPGADNTYNLGSSTPLAWANVYAYAYPSPSDYRLKKNVSEIRNSLSSITSLRPVEYEYKELEGTRVGFIAHELQEIYPELVRGEKDGVDSDGNPAYQEVLLDDLVPHLVCSIKELKAELDTVKAELAALRSQI